MMVSFSCGRSEADAEGCGGAESRSDAATSLTHGPAALALRLDPPRDLQRLHALLVAHAPALDDRLHRPQGTRRHPIAILLTLVSPRIGTCIHSLFSLAEGASIEEREAEAATLRELQETMFDLEHRHRIYRRSLARETKYGSKQAPIGDDNYLHLAGAAGSVDGGPFLWRPWRSDTSPTVDLDGKTLPLQNSGDVGSSTESLKLARHADERSSGKSTKSTGSGYLTMSCIKHEPSEDSDASAGRPARPPKPARLSPARAGAPPAVCEYVHVEPRARPEPAPDPELVYRCKEYELMTDFMSHARASDEETPPAVPPRCHATRARPPPRPTDSDPIPAGPTVSPPPDPPPDRPEVPCKMDTISTDDSLLDELQRDAYCVLKVCEDEPPTPEEVDRNVPKPGDERRDCGPFSRVCAQRKSNPIKSQTSSTRPLKTSSSTSNVHDAGATSSRPLTERLTPFFLKRKSKPAEEAAPRCARKEDNLIGRLTPRFGQSRLYGRGQSLELAPEPRTKRIERSATTVNIPARPMNSSLVANLKFLSLHRYGAGEGAPAPAPRPEPAPDALDAAAPTWRRSHAPSLLAAATTDIRL